MYKDSLIFLNESGIAQIRKIILKISLQWGILHTTKIIKIINIYRVYNN